MAGCISAIWLLMKVSISVQAGSLRYMYLNYYDAEFSEEASFNLAQTLSNLRKVTSHLRRCQIYSIKYQIFTKQVLNT